MPKKQFDLIVFDWDGTLMDSTAAIVRSIQAAARDLGLPVPDSRAASFVIGLGLQEAMQTVLPGLEAKYYPRARMGLRSGGACRPLACRRRAVKARDYARRGSMRAFCRVRHAGPAASANKQFQTTSTRQPALLRAA